MKTTVQNPDLARFVEAGTLYLGAPEAAELVRRHGVAACIEAIAANIRAARQAIGMDLRTMSDALGAAGRRQPARGHGGLGHSAVASRAGTGHHCHGQTRHFL